MWFQRRKNRGGWLLSLLGITGAYFLGREAGKNRMPHTHSDSTPRTNTWEQDILPTDIDSDPEI